MTTPPEQNYVMDPELMEEMVRLDGQGRMLTQSMGGVLPELSQQKRASLRNVLDLACGPGEWVLDLAFDYPDLHVMGVDISEIMIDYASAQTMARQLPASFQVLNVLKHPMPFEGASFDLVNMRLVFGFMQPSQWPALLAECMRLLRPGGLIRVTECERALSSNVAFEHYVSIWTEAFFRDQRSFSSDGFHFGLFPRFKPLLKQAGFTELRHVPYMIDISVGAKFHQPFFADALAGVQVAKPFLKKTARSQFERDEIEKLYDQLHALVNQEDFGAYWPLMTFLGCKPRTL